MSGHGTALCGLGLALPLGLRLALRLPSPTELRAGGGAWPTRHTATRVANRRLYAARIGQIYACTFEVTTSLSSGFMPVGTTPGSHSHYCRIHRLSVSRLSLGEHRTPCRTAPARPHRRPRRTGHSVSETLGHSAICARDRLAFSLAFLSRHAEHSSTMYIDARARDARADSANLHKSTGHKESTRWSADRRARGGTATIVASGRRRGAWLPVEPRRI